MNNKERIKSFCSVSLLAAAPVLYGVAMPESVLTRIDVTAAVREAGDLLTTWGRPGKWENHRARRDYHRFYGAVSRSSL